LITLRDKS